ncbi:hypothetical protein [Nocardia testacea]|uniref:hypothetical protein n=1 Tax=Nocardia testacea TaxID=248551 RepID=UPI0002E6FFDC|nr:hypothetical protein [Nocardia testacea]
MTQQSRYTRPAPSASAQRSLRGRDSYDDMEPVLADLAALDPADPARARLREEAIGRCLPLARRSPTPREQRAMVAGRRR